jgi:hypothetical protein
MEYTPSKVWTILTEGSEDPDEEIDVEMGLRKLPLADRVFLVRLSQGYSAAVAMKEAGLRGNQTQLKREVLGRLVETIG